MVQDPLPIRKRVCGPKVRTGCITCKIRHVKCDEGKPSCKRCLSTGRKCDGYEAPAPSKPRKRRKRFIQSEALEIDDGTVIKYGASSTGSSSPEPVHRDALGIFGGSPAEARALAFFIDRAASRISSFADPSFWFRVVAQLGTEEAIRKSIMAVSLIFEKAERGDPTELFAYDRNVLLFYNKAIQSLRESLVATNRMPTPIALIACILFICLEFLRGNITGSIMHTRSGLKLIEDLRQENADKFHSSTPESDIIEELEPIFCRLQLQSALFGKFSLESATIATPQETYRPAADLLERMELSRRVRFDDFDSSATNLEVSEKDTGINQNVFTSIEQAKRELFLFLHDAHAMGVKSYEGKYQGTITEERRSEHLNIVTRFLKWRAAFKHFLERNSERLTPVEHIASKVLQVYSRSSFVWVACSLDPNETAYDDYRQEFQDVVDWSEDVVNAYFAGEQKDSEKILVSNLSIIPPLHLTAWKCRYPEVRRKAIRILSSRHWREGLFDSHRSARTFEKVIEIEETAILSCPVENNPYPTPKSDVNPYFSSLRNYHSSPDVLTPPDDLLMESKASEMFNQQLPPEWARIHHVQFDFENSNPDLQKVVFYSKPFGPQREWLRREETIPLSRVNELGASLVL